MLIGKGGGIKFDCCKVNRELIIVEKVHNFVSYDRKTKNIINY
jgi:hypothetical protein